MMIDDDSTPDRLAAALSFITQGRAVGCPGFSICVCDGTLRIDVEYPADAPNDDLGKRLIASALRNVDRLLDTEPAYHTALSPLPRNVALVWSNGKGEVEIAKVVSGKLAWHSSGT